MKKFISMICASALTAAAVSPVTSSAGSENDYTPSLYLKAAESDEYTIVDETHINVDLNGRNTPVIIDLSVFVDDTSARLSNVSPKLKSSCETIRLTKPVQCDPCAYDYDSLMFGCYLSTAVIYNTVNAMCTTAISMPDSSKIGAPMIWTGETSDAYALFSFKACVSQFTKDGTYEIYFLTEHEDDPDQPVTEVSSKNEDGSRTTVTPNVRSVSVTVTGGGADYLLGDVNDDGIVDAADASLILYANAQLANSTDEFTDIQKLKADVNGDGMYDSIDASAILVYNAAAANDSKILPFYLWACYNIY